MGSQSTSPVSATGKDVLGVLGMRKSLRGDPRVGSGYNGKGTCREEMKV